MDKKDIQQLLKGSYKKSLEDEGRYKIDETISSKRVKVYNDSDSNNVFVVHRGTANLKDWITDASMAFGYEKGNRFKHSKKVQKAAINKYGKNNITTLGHSLGGRLAEKYHKGKGEIITLNKAATPRSIQRKVPINQTDYRHSKDVVSFLSNFQKYTKKPIIINSKSINPLKVHRTEILRKLN
jgi:hypothetical protein